MPKFISTIFPPAVKAGRQAGRNPVLSASPEREISNLVALLGSSVSHLRAFTSKFGTREGGVRAAEMGGQRLGQRLCPQGFHSAWRPPAAFQTQHHEYSNIPKTPHLFLRPRGGRGFPELRPLLLGNLFLVAHCWH